jgi:hypothetical protein
MRILLSALALTSSFCFLLCFMASAITAFMGYLGASIGMGLLASWWFVLLVISSAVKTKYE